MRKIFGYLFFFLASIWSLVVIFKIYLAVSGHVDHLGRGPSEHIVSAGLQLILVAVAFLIGKKILNGNRKN